MNEYAVGIDLGTTNSCIAYVDQDGNVVVIPNSFGKNTTPSVLSIDGTDQRYIGDTAVSMENNNVFNTVRSIKRFMGTSMRRSIGDKKYSPEQISSFILSGLKEYAAKHLKQEVTQAVITVPAYFNNDQRTATKVAGEIAKLEVLQIINEPTAAALAYGLGGNKNEKILVFDLGGGTFDVTVLEITDKNVFSVLATSGDTSIGGDDFDNKIIDALSCNLGLQVDIPLARAILRNIAEEIKIALSDKEEVNIENLDIKIINETYTLNFKLTRNEFNAMIEPYLNKCKNCMNFAVRDAKLKYNQIDKIILVGGSTRIPYLRNKIEEWTNIAPDTSVDPDEAVAKGAAIQAALLTHQTTHKAVLLDVMPLTLGIAASNNMMVKMLSRNTTIPVDHEEIFTTAEDNQETVAIKVFQGERPRATDNKCIGQFKLEGIKPASSGTPVIVVTFQVDMNGILSVVAKDDETGQYKQITISGSSSLSQEEINRMIYEAEEHTQEDMEMIQKFSIIKALQDRKVQINKLLEKNIDVLAENEITRLEYYAKIISKEDMENTDIDRLHKIEANIEELMNLISGKINKKAKSVMERYVL